MESTQHGCISFY